MTTWTYNIGTIKVMNGDPVFPIILIADGVLYQNSDITIPLASLSDNSPASIQAALDVQVKAIVENVSPDYEAQKAAQAQLASLQAASDSLGTITVK